MILTGEMCQLPTSGEPPLTSAAGPSQSPSLGDGARLNMTFMPPRWIGAAAC
jgi:hypothetical protein